MADIIDFPSPAGFVALENQQECDNFLVGYAACLADMCRAGAGDYAEEAMEQSGITVDAFCAAGVEDYDLTELVRLKRGIVQ